MQSERATQTAFYYTTLRMLRNWFLFRPIFISLVGTKYEVARIEFSFRLICSSVPVRHLASTMFSTTFKNDARIHVKGVRMYVLLLGEIYTRIVMLSSANHHRTASASIYVTLWRVLLKLFGTCATTN